MHGPEFPIVRFRNQVDALIGGRQLEFRGQRVRDFTEQPNMFELAGILWFKLEVGFNELLERVAFLFFRKGMQFGVEVFP